MSKRTDVHRPSAIQPEDYVFVACIEHVKAGAGDIVGQCDLILSQRQILDDHMKMTGGWYSMHEHGGSCHICGAYMIDTAVFYHAKTNSYIRTGFDCADKLDMGDSKLFRHWRKLAAADRKFRAGKAKAEATLREAGLERAWAIYQGTNDDPTAGLNDYWKNRVQNDVMTAADIVSKLVRYGSISDGQERFLRVLLDRIDNASEHAEKIEAERAAERAAAQDAPAGRVEIAGTVVSVKDYGYSDWGTGLIVKMTVKDDRGFRVWLTVPRSIHDVERGDRVTFRATLQPSDDDSKFAFAKRPTNAEIIERAERQEAA